MRALIAAIAVSVFLVTACSKSPIESAVDVTNKAAQKLMAPLAPKDASKQAEGLIHNLDLRPDCAVYIDRLREAGHGAPADGATQWAIAHIYDNAQKARCVKS
jgi:hypothetical protein